MFDLVDGIQTLRIVEGIAKLKEEKKSWWREGQMALVWLQARSRGHAFLGNGRDEALNGEGLNFLAKAKGKDVFSRLHPF